MLNNPIVLPDLIYNRLYHGCLIAGLAHAIMVGRYPELAHEHSWDDMSYSTQDSFGTRGTITFSDGFVVGAFRDESRVCLDVSPFAFLKGASQDVINLATTETFQYLLDDVDGVIKPVITSLFWIDSGISYGNTSFDELLNTGAHVLSTQLLPHDASIAKWVDTYGMTSNQKRLLEALYLVKRDDLKKQVYLTKAELQLIDADGFDESKDSFGELFIFGFPD